MHWALSPRTAGGSFLPRSPVGYHREMRFPSFKPRSLSPLEWIVIVIVAAMLAGLFVPAVESDCGRRIDPATEDSP